MCIFYVRYVVTRMLAYCMCHTLIDEMGQHFLRTKNTFIKTKFPTVLKSKIFEPCFSASPTFLRKFFCIEFDNLWIMNE